MSEKKKSFAEFLSNEALNPGVNDNKLQKVDVGLRDVAEDNDYKEDKKVVKAVAPKIKKKPVALFGVLCLVFLGLTIGLTFVTPWCLFGILPTLLCFWKMVLNNADNNYKSVVDRYDSDYLERIDSKEKERQKCQEMEQEIEEKKEDKKEEKKNKSQTKEEEDDEEKEVEEKKEKKERKGKKSSKTKDEDEDEIDDFDDDDEEEEEEEEKKSKKAEKSDKKFGSKVETSGKKDVENDNSKTSLIERNKRMRGQRAMY